ncbi:uncharacterized protein LOC6529452 [Drosophila yakuba]|uniref:Uncharacterized protein n=1 Tax=Drosophila yakuba TaxID=7245 RepID=B4P8Q8_DROYA|nr:uncharacterized protein LOC6529452 [Drosophila yakuba]EDW90166.2 uncharacterized protein Dyak_GE13127 [Drosophila yakuba]
MKYFPALRKFAALSCHEILSIRKVCLSNPYCHFRMTNHQTPIVVRDTIADMDYLDIESFRSKYSDITVTAVPTRSKADDEPAMATDQETTIKQHVPRVEITRVNGGASAGSGSTANPAMMQRNRQQPNSAALAYANEYKEVMAKLEYTKYMQAQLQMMSATKGGGSAGAPGLDFDLYGTSTNIDENANIVDKYAELLNVLGEMRSNVPTTMAGLRAPKERLQRDIAQARLKVRQCLLLLHQGDEESDDADFQGAPTKE